MGNSTRIQCKWRIRQPPAESEMHASSSSKAPSERGFKISPYAWPIRISSVNAYRRMPGLQRCGVPELGSCKRALRQTPAHFNSYRGTSCRGTRRIVKDPGPKAEVGNCPSCARATRVAVPPSFELGAYSQLRELGTGPWASYGPWAGRRLAAATYVLDS